MTTGSTPDSRLNWNRQEAIAVPQADREGRLAIRRADWNRLKRCVDNAGTAPTPSLVVIYSILAGVAASFGASIVSLQQSTGLPAWVVPFYVCVTGFSALCAVVFVVVDLRVKKDHRVAIDDIKRDMEEIQQMFELEEEAAIIATSITSTDQAQGLTNPGSSVLGVGSRVSHPSFGVGTITARDHSSVTIMFDNADIGTRRIRANYPHLRPLVER